MFKKFTASACLALLGFSFSTHGYAFPAGAYVGLKLGSSYNRTKYAGNITSGGFTLEGIQTSFFSDSMVPSFSAGYGWQFTKHWAMQLQAFASKGVSSSTNAFGAYGQYQYGYGISVLPGYLVTPQNFLYLRLGLVRGKFKNKINRILGAHLNSQKFLSGFQTGLGFENQVSDNLTVLMEYDFTYYNKFNQTYNLTNPFVSELSTSRRLVDNQVNLGINYYLNGKALSNEVTQLLASGFYLGGSFGYSVSQVPVTLADIGTGHIHYSDSQYNYGVFAGYAWRLLPKFRLATQFNVSHDSANEVLKESTIFSSSPISYKLGRDMNYTVSVLPGYMLTPADELYMRFAVSRTRFKLSNNTSPSSQSANLYSWGYGIGFGDELAITDHMSLRGDYLYQNYPDRLDGSRVALDQRLLKYKSNTFSLGLSYYF